MSASLVVASVSLLVVLLLMLGEMRLSRRNERELRRAGAVEPPGDVYATMRWAYPMAFVVMAVDGAFAEAHPGRAAWAGAGVLAAAKILKFWAIATLGRRWTFRVLVLPGAPLVTHGPYALVPHPNYVAVIGELAGMLLLVGAWITGPLVTLLFSLLLRRRIQVEDRALRHSPC